MKTSRLMKIIVLCLVMSLLLPGYANAAVIEPVEPMASYYLDAYNSYVCAMGNGRIEVWFDVLADDDMDDLGALSIMIYESTDNVNWTWKDTYLHEDYPTMLGHNDFFYCSYVSYQGIAGRYYKAYVGIWAGVGDGGDSRYMWTAVEKAT